MDRDSRSVLETIPHYERGQDARFCATKQNAQPCRLGVAIKNLRCKAIPLPALAWAFAFIAGDDAISDMNHAMSVFGDIAFMSN